MLTRDSLALWVAFGVAVVTYLSAAPSPLDWGYAEYLKAAAFLLAWASGKLATSPLAGKVDPFGSVSVR